MKRVVLGAWLLCVGISLAQSPTVPQGDIFSSNSMGGAAAESPAAALGNLYKLSAQITDDPSSGYDPKTAHWLQADAVQSQWFNSMAKSGNALTQQQRRQMVPCAAHLNTAIDEAERGFRIQISQPNNAPAQASAQNLLAKARKDFALCSRADAFGTGTGGTGSNGTLTAGNPSNGNLPGGQPIQGGTSNNGPAETGGRTPGGNPGGQNPPMQGAVNKPGGGNTPGQSGTPNTGNNPSNPLSNTVDYVRGLTDGLGGCIKSFGDLLAGAGFFAKGDFVNAARVWGLTPGQSVTLKSIASELSQQVVGSNVSAYQQGQIAGRRICNYALVPAAAKAGGAILRSGAGATATAPRPGLPGSSAANPIKGSSVLEASTKSPATLANQWIETANGPIQTGDYVGGGTFGKVYKVANQPRVIKISTSEVGSAESFPRQVSGAERLMKLGIDTPTIYDYGKAGPSQAATLVMDDVLKKWPGATQFSQAEFNRLAGAARNQVTNAVAQASNKLIQGGDVWIDGHINNMMFRPNGTGGLTAIIHDADMIMTAAEVRGELANAASIPGAVLRSALDGPGLGGILNGPWTVQSLMNTLFRARFGGNLPGAAGGSGTLPRQ